MSLFEMDTTESVTQSTTNDLNSLLLSLPCSQEQIMDKLVWHNTSDVGHEISPKQQLQLQKLYQQSGYNRQTRKAHESELRSMCRKESIKYPVNPDWAPKTKSFWSFYERNYVNLNTPATAGNRRVNVNAVAKHLRDGFNPALWITPKVVAIPGFLLRQAMEMEKYKKILSMYHIVEEGFQIINGTEWYVSLIDGEHRRMMAISLKGIDLSNIDTVLQITGNWEVDVTFAKVFTPDLAVDAIMDAYNLMTQMNGKKIRKWGEHEEFFGDVFAGNEDQLRFSEHLYAGGVYATNGRTSVGFGKLGSPSIKVQIPQYRYQVKDPKLNDEMRLSGVEFAIDIIKKAGLTVDQINETNCFKTIFLHTFSLLMASNSTLRKKNGLYTEFVDYIVDELIKIKNKKRVRKDKPILPADFSALFSALKKQGALMPGVNSHHNEHVAVYAALVSGFKEALYGHGQYTNFPLNSSLEFAGVFK